MSKARHRIVAAFGLLLGLLANLLLPISGAQATAPWPTAPVRIIQCPGGGFYAVDANGVASRGGQPEYVDEGGSIVAGGNCAGNLILDASVRIVEEFAFDSAALTSVTLPSGLTTIRTGAFYNNNLTSLSVPDSVTSIGSSAFNLAPLTSLHLGSSVVSIGGNAFATARLTTLEIPSSVTTLGNSVFRDSPLTSLTINSPSLTIGSNTFSAAATANLPCFYNLGGASIPSATLSSAKLPNPCVVHSITVTAGPNGSVANPYSYIDDQATPSYVITPATGYRIDHVLVDGTDVTSSLVTISGETKSYNFVAVTADHTLSVSFSAIASPAPAPAPAPVSPPVAEPAPVVTPTPTPTPTASPTPSPTAEPTPTPTPTPVPATTASFRVVKFELGSATLSSVAKDALQRLAPKLSSASRITITGFSQGPKVLPADVALSRNRAIAVRDYLKTLLNEKVSVQIKFKQFTQVGERYRTALITIVR
jgi:outer membrane protein OmpA-like peptidoglycan-associated protein